MFLNEGFEAEGEVRFLGRGDRRPAQLRWRKLKNAGGMALVLRWREGDRRTLFLNNGFEAEGEVRFAGAEIGGQIW